MRFSERERAVMIITYKYFASDQLKFKRDKDYFTVANHRKLKASEHSSPMAKVGLFKAQLFVQ